MATSDTLDGGTLKRPGCSCPDDSSTYLIRTHSEFLSLASSFLQALLIIYRGFMDDVLNGRRQIYAEQYPTFLYDLMWPYDPEDPSDGLCRSEVLVRVSHFI